MNIEKLIANSEHNWKLNSNGEPDDFALDVDPDEGSMIGHNGYECLDCGYIFCEHCVSAGWEKFVSECK